MSEMIAITKLYPPHPVRDAGKRDRLAQAMALSGWTGRSLLAMDCGGYYKCLTGSHRLAAARQAGLEELPVVITAEIECIPDFGEMLLAELSEAGADEEALGLLRQEIAHDLVELPE